MFECIYALIILLLMFTTTFSYYDYNPDFTQTGRKISKR